MKYPVIYETHVRNHTREGTFSALQKDLQRIQSLGVDILWLMPIHPIGEKGRKGSFGSPYAVKDYRSIAADLGTEDDFRKLIEAAHDLGMKLIIDVVFNHTAMDSVLVQEHPEWYLKDESGHFMRKIEEWSDVYDLDFSAAGLTDYLIESLAKWVSLGVDGFRCDVAALVPLDFWMRAADELGRIKPLVWLAESVEKSFIQECRDRGLKAYSDPELHQVFNISYDYDGLEYLLAYHEGRGPLQSYLDHLFVQETMFPGDAVKMRFLENHDRIRAAAWIEGERRLINWTLFSHCLPGSPLIYMGQEYGHTHWPDFFHKDPVEWEEMIPGFLEFFKWSLAFSRRIKQECSIFRIEQTIQGVVKILWIGENVQYEIMCNLENRHGVSGFAGRNLVPPEKQAEVWAYHEFPLVFKTEKP